MSSQWKDFCLQISTKIHIELSTTSSWVIHDHQSPHSDVFIHLLLITHKFTRDLHHLHCIRSSLVPLRLRHGMFLHLNKIWLTSSFMIFLARWGFILCIHMAKSGYHGPTLWVAAELIFAPLLSQSHSIWLPSFIFYHKSIHDPLHISLTMHTSVNTQMLPCAALCAKVLAYWQCTFSI